MTDKEKLEKALVHLKKFIDGDCVCDSDILADFPELKDSEDEKIRKAILVKMKATAKSNNFFRKEEIEWMERQKEQKPAISTPIFRVGDYIRNKKTGDKVVIEQIDVKLKIYFYVSSDGMATVHSDFKWEDQNDWELIGQKIEQKPSEKQNYSSMTDFERAIHRGFLCAGVVNVPVIIIKETAQECMAKIKPIEWGRWEEEIIANAIKQLYSYANSYHNANNDTREKEVRKVADELKSLRFSWKPSEEQMEALENSTALTEEQGAALYSLVQDLKKLYYDRREN